MHCIVKVAVVSYAMAVIVMLRFIVVVANQKGKANRILTYKEVNNMGTYGVNAEELKPKLEEFLSSLEGDTNAEELAKAYNMLSKKYDLGDMLMFRWYLKDMKDDNKPIKQQIAESGLKEKWAGE